MKLIILSLMLISIVSLLSQEKIDTGYINLNQIKIQKNKVIAPRLQNLSKNLLKKKRNIKKYYWKNEH